MKKLFLIGAVAVAVCGMCQTASAKDGYIDEGDEGARPSSSSRRRSR